MVFADQLRTERLSLHGLRKRDLRFFCTLMGDKPVRHFLGGAVIWSQRLRRFRWYLAAPDFVGVWVVNLEETNQSNGLVELWPDKGGADYEISYQFVPTSWGKGFEGESVQAAINHAMNEAGLEWSRLSSQQTENRM